MIIFIPIKKNSQRVIGKNFRKFNGIELYKYVINNFNKLGYDIYVDTDSDEIFEFYKNSNINVVKRDKSLIGDDVSVVDLIKDLIIKNNINDYICQLHVTSPLLNIKTIKDAKKHLNKFDSVTGCDIIYNRFWKKEGDTYNPVNHDPNLLIQTQDLTPLYLENSTFYIFHSRDILITNQRISKNNHFYEVKYPENLDIDTEDDWDLIKKYEND